MTEKPDTNNLQCNDPGRGSENATRVPNSADYTEVTGLHRLNRKKEPDLPIRRETNSFQTNPFQVPLMIVSRTFPAMLALTALLGSVPVAFCEPSGSDPAMIRVQGSAPALPPRPLFDRWLALDTLSHAERYRNAFATGGVHDFENAQARSLIAGKVKIDGGGHVAIGFRASSGRYFNWAYSNFTGESYSSRIHDPAFQASSYTHAEALEKTRASLVDPNGVAIANHKYSNGWEFYMRELYLDVTPVKPVSVEFGSLGIERGLSSEITTFDEDGYISGERIRLHAPRQLLVDEVAFTNAFFGDLQTVNLFARGASLRNFNYRQLSAKKQVNSRVGVSGEYTWQAGTDTLREAALVKTGESRVVDKVRVELYQRLNTITFPGLAKSKIGPIAPLPVSGGAGFAVAVEKKAGRLSGDFGFASVDKDYSVYDGSRFVHAVAFALNGDTYGQGKRPFAHASLELVPGVTAFGFYTHAVGSRVRNFNEQSLNAGVSFNFKSMINRERPVF